MNDAAKNSTNVRQDCSAGNKDRALTDTETFCPFDNSAIPPECTAAQNYSFPLGKPCILIKLNRVSIPSELLCQF